MEFPCLVSEELKEGPVVCLQNKKRQSLIHNFVTVFISLCVRINYFLGYIRYPSVLGDNEVVISMMFQA